MKLKQKLLLALVASILATPAAFAARTTDGLANTTTDDADDVQDVSITVPEVALIDVSQATVPTIVASHSGDAGDAQVFSTSTNLTQTVAYSSNVATTTSKRKIDLTIGTATADPLSGLPANMKLTISSTPTAAQGINTDCVITGTVVSGCDADGLIKDIQNIATQAAPVAITYTPAMIDPTLGMVGNLGVDTAKNLRLVYTLSTGS